MQMRSMGGDFGMRATPGPACVWFLLKGAMARIAAAGQAFFARARFRQKQLALVESVALGDRRLVGVIQFEGQRFLVGSAPSSVTLLAQLPDARTTSARASAVESEGEGQ